MNFAGHRRSTHAILTKKVDGFSNFSNAYFAIDIRYFLK
jgi:hypothetical protein